MPFEVEIQSHQIIFCIHNTRPYIICAFVALHERNLRFRMSVVIPVMPVVESVTLVITETVVFHYITHPFQIRNEHLLHIHIVMTPVTRTIPVLTVIVITGRLTVTLTCIRILIHFIVLADITLVRLECTVLTEIHLRKIAPTGPTRTVINHDICNHLRTIGMQSTDQGLQLLTRTPVRVLVAVLFRVITRTISVCTRRQPNIVKICTDLLRLRRQGLPFGIAVLTHARSTCIIRLVVKSLHQHGLTLCRNRTRVDIIHIFAFPAYYTLTFRTDVQLILPVFELDVEIIAIGNTDHVLVSVTRETRHRIAVQINCPRRFIDCVIQLAVITFLHIHMRQILLKTFVLSGRLSSKIRLPVHQDAVTLRKRQRCAQQQTQTQQSLFHRILFPKTSNTCSPTRINNLPSSMNFSPVTCNPLPVTSSISSSSMRMYTV